MAAPARLLISSPSSSAILKSGTRQFVSSAAAFVEQLQHPTPQNYTPELARAFLAAADGGSVDLLPYPNVEGAQLLQFNNPSKKNALTGKMMVELADSIATLAKDESTKVVVVQGVDGAFCTGADLQFVKTIANPNDGWVMCTWMGNTLQSLSYLSLPSIARIEGFALGGGSEIASACDVRLIHKDAKIGFVQGRMGVTPGWGCCSRIVNIVGKSKAIELLATSAVLNAKQLKEIGFVNHIYETNDEALEYIGRFTKLSVEAHRGAKRSVRDVSRGTTPEAKLDAERRVFASLWGGPRQQEALAEKPKHK